MPARLLISLFTLAFLLGCAETAKLPFESTVGASPQLAEPNETLFPTANYKASRYGLYLRWRQ